MRIDVNFQSKKAGELNVHEFSWGLRSFGIFLSQEVTSNEIHPAYSHSIRCL